MKQLNLAVQNYAQVNGGRLPAMVADSYYFQSLLPYMEQGNLENSADIYFVSITGMGCPSDHTSPTWLCPHGHGVGSYAPNFQVFGGTPI